MVRVRHPGEFTEFIPLLQRGTEATTAGFTVSFDPPAVASRVETTTEIGRRRLVVMRVRAKDTLTYPLQFAQ